jgi:hypothetical protein
MDFYKTPHKYPVRFLLAIAPFREDLVVAVECVYSWYWLPSVRDFASYCRLVKCERNSAGKSLGTGGNKIGNACLKWAPSFRESERRRNLLSLRQTCSTSQLHFARRCLPEPPA